MMYINRFKSDPLGTFGAWMDEDGHQLCFTVERPYTGDHPCIAPGVYSFNQYDSPSKGDVWLRDETQTDDGRTMIEIHPGNTIKDLKGCIAVGDKLGTVNGLPAVMNSRITFIKLKKELPNSFELTIRDTPL